MGSSVRPDPEASLAALYDDAREARRANPKNLDIVDKAIAQHAAQLGINDLTNFQQLRARVSQPSSRPVRNTGQVGFGPGSSFVADATRQPIPIAAKATAPTSDVLNTQYEQAAVDRKAQRRSVYRGALLNSDRMIRSAVGDPYSTEEEQQYADFQKQHPVADAVGEMAGGLATSPATGLLGALGKASTAAHPVLNAMRAGAIYGGVSGAFDGDGAGDRLGKGLLGAAGGAVGAGTVAGLLRLPSKFTPSNLALGDVRANVRQLGDFTAQPGAGQPPIPNDLPTMGQRFRSMFHPAEGVMKENRGLQLLQQQQDEATASGRGAQTTLMDLDQTGRMLGLGANAVRGNPGAASSPGVQRLTGRSAVDQGRGALAPGFVANDLAAATSPADAALRQGVNFEAAQQNPGMQVADVMRQSLGAEPPILSSSRQMVPYVSGQAAEQVPRGQWDATQRGADLEHSLQQWASSQEGYGGLQPQRLPPLPQVQDAQVALAHAAQREPGAHGELNGILTGLQNMVGGSNGEIGTSPSETRILLGRIDDLMRKGYATTSPAKPYQAISDETKAVLNRTRDAVTAAADAGFRTPQGRTFTDLNTEYFNRSEQGRALERGRELANGMTADGQRVAPTLADMRQEVAGFHQRGGAAAVQELRFGIRSEILNDLESQTANASGGPVANFAKALDDRYAGSPALRIAFPTKQQFLSSAGHAKMLQLLQEGPEQWLSKDPTALDATVKGIEDVLPPGAQRTSLLATFRASMQDRLERDMRDPNKVSAFLNEYGGQLRSDNGDLAKNLDFMFGPTKARDLRLRLEKQARFQTTEDVISTAANNPSSTAEARGLASVAAGSGGSATKAASIVAAPVRRIGSILTGKATQNAMLKLTTDNGQPMLDALGTALRARPNLPVPGLLGGALLGAQHPAGTLMGALSPLLLMRRSPSGGGEH